MCINGNMNCYWYASYTADGRNNWYNKSWISMATAMPLILNVYHVSQWFEYQVSKLLAGGQCSSEGLTQRVFKKYGCVHKWWYPPNHPQLWSLGKLTSYRGRFINRQPRQPHVNDHRCASCAMRLERIAMMKNPSIPDGRMPLPHQGQAVHPVPCMDSASWWQIHLVAFRLRMVTTSTKSEVAWTSISKRCSRSHIHIQHKQLFLQ